MPLQLAARLSICASSGIVSPLYGYCIPTEEKPTYEGHWNFVPFLRIATRRLRFAGARPGWAGDGWERGRIVDDGRTRNEWEYAAHRRMDRGLSLRLGDHGAARPGLSTRTIRIRSRRGPGLRGFSADEYGVWRRGKSSRPDLGFRYARPRCTVHRSWRRGFIYQHSGSRGNFPHLFKARRHSELLLSSSQGI